VLFAVVPAAPMIDFCALVDAAPPMYGPRTRQEEADAQVWDEVIERLDRALPLSYYDDLAWRFARARSRCAAPRRAGHRVSRVARRAARKSAASSDSDGEPPAAQRAPRRGAP